MAYKDLPFSFLDAFRYLHKSYTPQNRTHGDVYAECWDCGSHRMGCNLDTNVCNCLKCNAHGNVKKYVAMHAGISLDEAYKEMMVFTGNWRDLNGNSNRQAYTKPKVEERRLPQARRKKSNEELDIINNWLLDQFSLCQQDYMELKSRGFSDKTIEACRFRSWPENFSERDNIEFMKKFQRETGINPEGRPGFYMTPEKVWVFKNGKGIIQPFVDAGHRIFGFHTRRRDDELKKMKGKQAKCLWHTSADEYMGTKAEAGIHFACDWVPTSTGALRPADKNPDGSRKMWTITEGMIKAELYHQYTGEPTMAVPGVNAASQLLPYLKWLSSRGVTDIRLAFDADYRTNPHVQKAMERTEQAILQSGMNCKRARWNTFAVINGSKVDCLKGIDDYYAYHIDGIIPKKYR